MTGYSRSKAVALGLGLLSVSAVVLTAVGLVILTDGESVPPITVEQDYDGFFVVEVDQKTLGPGVLHVTMDHWGDRGEANVRASSPYVFSCSDVLSVEYVSDTGTVTVWGGGM